MRILVDVVEVLCMEWQFNVEGWFTNVRNLDWGDGKSFYGTFINQRILVYSFYKLIN